MKDKGLDENGLCQTERLAIAWCNLNCFEWDEYIGPKPEGFDNLPISDTACDIDSRTVYPTKSDYVVQIMFRIETIIGRAAIDRAWWVYELGKPEEEWLQAYLRKPPDVTEQVNKCERAYMLQPWEAKRLTERLLQRSMAGNSTNEIGEGIEHTGKRKPCKKRGNPELKVLPTFIRKLFFKD